ncbi:hypothetical protein N4G70_29230 [Streptomyces sp. ASQP_92]|uniref:hypothetical protein n=1 Tax=Streptomyces sp. ASQP_92 TaxID=2979116 RepID=UPI0021BED899|nr:hypothetical protein [Streptomyces sp. ASQP_92]MCT9092924.1 hypothetical protein [Streptomyces sp. ASQP_92]
MTLTLPWQGTGSHRAVDEVARLRHELAGAGHLIESLRGQVDDANAARDRANEKASQYDEAVARADAVVEAMAEMQSELRELRAHLANCEAVTVPPMERDIDPGDHPTVPVDVKSLRERFASGPVVSLHHSPQAAVDPAHVPGWVKPDTDSVELPVHADRLVQGAA